MSLRLPSKLFDLMYGVLQTMNVTQLPLLGYYEVGQEAICICIYVCMYIYIYIYEYIDQPKILKNTFAAIPGNAERRGMDTYAQYYPPGGDGRSRTYGYDGDTTQSLFLVGAGVFGLLRFHPSARFFQS